jgi:antitoxin HicB
MKLTYPALITQEGDDYLVEFPDVKGAVTYGESLEHALAMASEALSGVLEVMLENEQDIPLPSKPKGKNIYYVAPEASVQAAVLFHLNRGDRSLSDIARALGTSWAAAQRLENPRHSPTVKQLEKAAAAVGKKLVISFE